MSRSPWLVAASLLALTACAGHRDEAMTAPAASPSASMATPMQTNPTPQAQPAPQPQTTSPTPQAQATPTPGVAPTTFSDAQLRSFATAATAIQPLNAQLQTATPEQRTSLVEQIRAVLTQNNLDGATYNAIAAQAQADPALAARITALNNGASSPG